MTSYSKGLHHYHIRKRIYQKHEPFPSKNKLKRNFDKLIYIAVIFGPIMTIPQLLKIWTSKNAAGVSFIAWASFSVISILWLTYVHHNFCTPQKINYFDKIFLLKPIPLQKLFGIFQNSP